MNSFHLFPALTVTFVERLGIVRDFGQSCKYRKLTQTVRAKNCIESTVCVCVQLFTDRIIQTKRGVSVKCPLCVTWSAFSAHLRKRCGPEPAVHLAHHQTHSIHNGTKHRTIKRSCKGDNFS